MEKVTAVCLGLRLQYCQSCQFSQDDGFCGERRWILWRRRRIFYFFLIFAKNPSSSPHCSSCVRHMLQCLHCILMSEAPTLSMCRHTNEGIPSTEHVHMLHWACADIIMRGNPLTDMTDNTEDANPNRQCLHTLKRVPCFAHSNVSITQVTGEISVKFFFAIIGSCG